MTVQEAALDVLVTRDSSRLLYATFSPEWAPNCFAVFTNHDALTIHSELHQ